MKARPGTLGEIPAGSRVVLEAPLLDAHRTRRLAELGLRNGVEVRVLHRTPGGGRVVAVEDVRIALDRATLNALPVHPPLTDRSTSGHRS